MWQDHVRRLKLAVGGSAYAIGKEAYLVSNLDISASAWQVGHKCVITTQSVDL